MSWSMFMGVVAYDEKTKECKVLSDIQEAWFLKNLCDTRCMLCDDIESENLPESAYEVIDKYTSYDYVGTYRVEDIEQRMLEKVNDYNYGEAYMIKRDANSRNEYLKAIKDKGEVDYYERIKSVKSDFIVIVEPVLKSRGGHFYSSRTFRDLVKKYRDNYDTLMQKKAQMKQITSSLKYLALNDKAKENVMSEYTYLDDEIEETVSSLEACLYTIGVLEYFDDYEYKCYAYIYGD